MKVIAGNSNIDFRRTRASPEKSSLTSELDTHSTQSHLIWCGLGMVTCTERRHYKINQNYSKQKQACTFVSLFLHRLKQCHHLPLDEEFDDLVVVGVSSEHDGSYVWGEL